jgi:hypothetical protein
VCRKLACRWTCSAQPLGLRRHQGQSRSSGHTLHSSRSTANASRDEDFVQVVVHEQSRERPRAQHDSHDLRVFPVNARLRQSSSTERSQDLDTVRMLGASLRTIRRGMRNSRQVGQKSSTNPHEDTRARKERTARDHISLQSQCARFGIDRMGEKRVRISTFMI